MKRLRYLFVALLSMTLIGLELTWTRIFSAEFFYTFAFLILSLAVLGLGLGALALRFFPALARESRLPIYLLLTGFFVLVGPPAVFLLKLDFSQIFSSHSVIFDLLAAVMLLSSAYFTGGMALASIFRRYNQEMPGLYMADLLGAAVGVLAAILMMNGLGTQTATFFIAIPVLLAALLAGQRWQKVLTLGLFVLMGVFNNRSDRILQVDRQEPAHVVHTHWDAMAKVKVYEATGSYQMINIDNIARTHAYSFDGDWNKPDSLKMEFAIDVSRLIGQFDSCRYAVIGAGGGGDLLQPLQAGAARVYAVEVIPYINQMLTDGMLTDLTGGLYRDPRVEVITEDGRAFVRRYTNAFDILYSSSSNTFAALASGAFALAENYLFTTEAFIDYWRALSDSGYLVIEHQVYVPRLVSELQDALSHLQIADAKAHFVVYDWPQARRNILLLSKQPLPRETIRHAITGERDVSDSPFRLLFPAPDSLRDNLVNRIVTEGWQVATDSAKIDISPCTDNRPYIAQMGLWRNLETTRTQKLTPHSDLFGFPLSKLIIAVIVLIIVLLIIPLNLIPYFISRQKLKGVPWFYFFFIGMAFMIVEIVLIQKYTLFIGPSVYGIATVLLTLLLASGIGSRFSARFPTTLTFGGIVLWLLVDRLLLSSVTQTLASSALFSRILITSVLIFPVGFLMGMPFPKAALRVGELVDWGFAVNGAASVLGASGIMLVAFTWGFHSALMIAGFCYIAAWGLYGWKKAW
ncbi:hypothetical protein JW992_07770 [candidate division KSB1 bacterium]|nr:hypothetical protein [candidate division KSB1 bacterium]